MFKSFFWSKKWALWAWGGVFVIFLGIFAQTKINVMMNEWYGMFYDLLQKAPPLKGEEVELATYSTYEQFKNAIVKFLYLAFPYVLIATFIGYFSRLFTFAWREAMTFAYLSKWKSVKQDIEGSSQRMQEDIYRFARIVESMGVSILGALMTLVAFVPILYAVGKGVAVPFFTGDYALVTWSVVASVGGLVISWFVGIKLPHLEYNNQKAEASFRKELVYAEDDKKNYASMDTMIELFTGLKFNYKRLFLHYGYFDVWLYIYEQFMVIFAFLLVGGNLFTGLITLGVLMQISNAFSKVRSSFSVLTTNWTTITELRSIHKRLKEFEKNIGF